jgi:hypothetical protein
VRTRASADAPAVPATLTVNESLAVTTFSTTEWLITDPRVPRGNPAALLGFIQRVTDAKYEVIRFGGRIQARFYSTFEDAAASLAA